MIFLVYALNLKFYVDKNYSLHIYIKYEGVSVDVFLLQEFTDYAVNIYFDSMQPAGHECCARLHTLILNHLTGAYQTTLNHHHLSKRVAKFCQNIKCQNRQIWNVRNRIFKQC
jgi:hypothetical protein